MGNKGMGWVTGSAAFAAAISLAACGGGSSTGGTGGGGVGGIGGVGAVGGTGGVGAVGGTGGVGAVGGTGGVGAVGGTGGVGAVGGTGGTAGIAGTGGVGGTGGSTSFPYLPGGPTGDRGGQGECAALSEGIFVIEASVDTWWGKADSNATAPITRPGRGDVKSYFALYLFKANSDLSFNGFAQPCGTKLPPFAADAVCEAYEANFDPAPWDNIDLIPVTGNWDGPSAPLLNAPGTATIAPQIVTFGIDLPNLNAQWPTSAETTNFTFPDEEMDGEPGITAVMRTEGNFDWARYNTKNPDHGCSLAPGGTRPFVGAPPGTFEAIAGVPRIKRIMLGLRTALEGSITIPTCDPSITATGTGRTTYVEGRAYDCYNVNNEKCTSAGATFLDDNLPVYRPLNPGEFPPAMVAGKEFGTASGAFGAGGWGQDDTEGRGTRFRARRFGDLTARISCTQVQGAFN